jgi:hypothetical protein
MEELASTVIISAQVSLSYAQAMEARGYLTSANSEGRQPPTQTLQSHQRARRVVVARKYLRELIGEFGRRDP